MSVECAECEHDLRGGHAPDCTFYTVWHCKPCGHVLDVEDGGFSRCPNCGIATFSNNYRTGHRPNAPEPPAKPDTPSRRLSGDPVRIGEAEIKQAIAHFLSRQGSAEFDKRDVELLWNPKTGELSADAIPLPF